MKALSIAVREQLNSTFDRLRWYWVCIANWPLLLDKRFPKRKEYRSHLALCKGFDTRWLRWPIIGLSFFSSLEFVLFGLAGTRQPPSSLLWACATVSSCCAVLMIIYYVDVMARRLQCSLAEWVIIVAFLANLEGLIVSTPGIRAFPWLLLSLPLLVAAGVFFTAADSLIEAEVLGISRPLPRALLMLGNLIGMLGCGFFLAGLLLLGNAMIKASPFGYWSALEGISIAVMGIVVSIPAIISGRKTTKKGRAYLAEVLEKEPNPQASGDHQSQKAT